MHISEAATRFSPVEVWESRNPWLMEKAELIPDSGGPGTYRGGLGVEMFFQALEDCFVTCVVERTKSGAWGLAGGGAGRPNAAAIRYADGTRRPIAKATRLPVPKGATLELHTGGGGGYGPPAGRDPEAVRSDLREGYVTTEHARGRYPHAFEPRPE
jgi:N-methylhydantoinase B